MNELTLQECADYLEAATIQHTQDSGFAITHSGINANGTRFVLVNDCNGKTFVLENTGL